MDNKTMMKKDRMDLFSLISRYRRQIQGTAAFCILFFHVWNVIFTGVPGLEKAEAFVKRITFFGVDIFLLLSGMGLVFSRENSSVGIFYLKRITRLLPPFLLTAVLKLIFDGWTFQRFAYAVTGYGFYRKSIYYFLWFIPAIATLYLLFPLY